nr:hypothetical protein GCM10025699_60330 [Microbacterium flavescens]
MFVLSRVVSTVLLLGFARAQGPNAWTLPSPDYRSFATIWDGHWYYIISAVGYPTTVPTTADGHVGESAWAFMPAYPFLVRALTELTGAAFAPLAVLVSVLCAAGTALLLYRLMRHVLPEGTALFTVVLFCVSPLSPLLQVAYAESMFLLLLCGCLLLLVRRQYLPMLPWSPCCRSRVRGRSPSRSRSDCTASTAGGVAPTTRSPAARWRPSR